MYQSGLKQIPWPLTLKQLVVMQLCQRLRFMLVAWMSMKGKQVLLSQSQYLIESLRVYIARVFCKLYSAVVILCLKKIICNNFSYITKYSQWVFGLVTDKYLNCSTTKMSIVKWQRKRYRALNADALWCVTRQKLAQNYEPFCDCRIPPIFPMVVPPFTRRYTKYGIS